MNRILPKNARLVPETAKKVFSGEIFDIYQWQQKMYDNSFQTFEMAKRANTVQIIGIVEGKVAVLNEEQPDGTSRKFGLPGGRIDTEDDSPIMAAKREMLEETGLSFNNWKLFNVHQPLRKIEWFIYVYVACDISGQVPQKIDVGEKIEVKQISWLDFLTYGNKRTVFENDLTKFSNVKSLINTKEFTS